MYCTNCGQRLADDANFCWYCGTRINRDVAKLEPTNTIIDDVTRKAVDISIEDKDILGGENNHTIDDEVSKKAEYINDVIEDTQHIEHCHGGQLAIFSDETKIYPIESKIKSNTHLTLIKIEVEAHKAYYCYQDNITKKNSGLFQQINQLCSSWDYIFGKELDKTEYNFFYYNHESCSFSPIFSYGFSSITNTSDDDIFIVEQNGKFGYVFLTVNQTNYKVFQHMIPCVFTSASGFDTTGVGEQRQTCALVYYKGEKYYLTKGGELYEKDQHTTMNYVVMIGMALFMGGIVISVLPFKFFQQWTGMLIVFAIALIWILNTGNRELNEKENYVTTKHIKDLKK